MEPGGAATGMRQRHINLGGLRTCFPRKILQLRHLEWRKHNQILLFFEKAVFCQGAWFPEIYIYRYLEMELIEYADKQGVEWKQSKKNAYL